MDIQKLTQSILESIDARATPTPIVTKQYHICINNKNIKGLDGREVWNSKAGAKNGLRHFLKRQIWWTIVGMTSDYSEALELNGKYCDSIVKELLPKFEIREI